jgi:hypothetical protein
VGLQSTLDGFQNFQAAVNSGNVSAQAAMCTMWNFARLLQKM